MHAMGAHSILRTGARRTFAIQCGAARRRLLVKENVRRRVDHSVSSPRSWLGRLWGRQPRELAVEPSRSMPRFARLSCLLLVACAIGCEQNEDGSSPLDLDWTETPPPTADGLPPIDNGACSEEGASVPCGSVVEQFEDYVTCSEGTRTCTDGRWGECIGTRTTQKPAATGSLGVQLLALGTPTTCPT